MSFLEGGDVQRAGDPLDLSGGQAAREQTKLAKRAAEIGTAETRRQFDIGQELLEPFAQEAIPALGLQAQLAGAQGPESQAEAFQQFEDSPATQFLRDAGLKSALQGKTLGGANAIENPQVAEALFEHTQGLAAQDFGNQFNRLGSVAGTGQTSQFDLVGLGEQFSGDIVQQQQNAFRAQEAGLAAQRAARGTMLETGVGLAAGLGGGA